MLQETIGPEQIATCEIEGKVSSIITGNTKQARMTQERKENCLKTRTPRTMLFLRGKGCNIPPVYPKVSCNYECCFSGEELKAKAPLERPCNYIE